MLYPVNSVGAVSYKGSLLPAKNVEPAADKKETVKDVNLNGSEALASYNKAAVTNSKIKKLEPSLPTILQPEAIKVIEGERITTSTGTLHSIVKKTPDTTITYIMDKSAPNDAIQQIIAVDNKTGKPIRIQTNTNEIQEGKLPKTSYIEIKEFYPNSDNAKKLTVYENGKPDMIEESTYGDNGYKKHIVQYGDGVVYHVEEFPDKAQSKITRYDKDGQLIEIETKDEKNHSTETVKYENGKPVDTVVRKKTPHPNTTGKNPLNDPDLKPAEEYVLSVDPKTLEGKKSFYSNGALERIETDNMVYLFEPDGKLKTIEDSSNPGNKKMIVYNDDYYTVSDESKDNITKYTDFNKAGEKIVVYEDSKNDLRKTAIYTKEGYLETYFERKGDADSGLMCFDEKGNLLSD